MLTSEQEFIKNFRYVPDKKDKWGVLKPDEKGHYKGDCEDFSLTILWLLSGKSWVKLWFKILTFQAMFWYCKANGWGHVMLWHRGKGWIDNIHPEWREKPVHKKVYPYVAPLLFLTLLVKR